MTALWALTIGQVARLSSGVSVGICGVGPARGEPRRVGDHEPEPESRQVRAAPVARDAHRVQPVRHQRRGLGRQRPAPDLADPPPAGRRDVEHHEVLTRPSGRGDVQQRPAWAARVLPEEDLVRLGHEPVRDEQPRRACVAPAHVVQADGPPQRDALRARRLPAAERHHGQHVAPRPQAQLLRRLSRGLAQLADDARAVRAPDREDRDRPAAVVADVRVPGPSASPEFRALRPSAW